MRGSPGARAAGHRWCRRGRAGPPATICRIVAAMNVLLTLPMTIVESARAPSALPLPPAHTRRPSRTTASVACSAPATLRAASSAAGKRNASRDPSETIAARRAPLVAARGASRGKPARAIAGGPGGRGGRGTRRRGERETRSGGSVAAGTSSSGSPGPGAMSVSWPNDAAIRTAPEGRSARAITLRDRPKLVNIANE